MDNPGASLFQDADLKLSSSQNIEEEEDLEDQRRRNEELQNLLTAKLDDFNYDESTINSSNNVSIVSLNDVQNKYRNADPYEQLKVLYDVRLRELNSLRNEYDTVKQEMSKEKDVLKNKLIIYEAELQQTKVSFNNANELLVEKSGIIAELRDTSRSQKDQILNYEKAIENFRLEISTYQTTINDLQLQIQRDINPFNLEAKRFNSEELQKAYQDKIDRLDMLLEEETKTAKIYEKEKNLAQSEIQKLVEQETDYKNTINILTKNFDNAQKQCNELINVIELLTKENGHLQDRVDVVYNKNSPEHSNKKYENNNLVDHVEKLKKMLLDKSVHIDSLNSKLRSYESNIKELLEFRQLKNDVYKKEFQQCDNKNHTKSLLLMQNDLQNYRRIIDDKNQQILILNSTNRDLLKKMEEMLSQTRNDIEIFSHKYNLPQLEKMSEDLKEAEEKIKELEEKLERSEGKRLSLVQRMQKSEKNIEKELKKELDLLKLNNEKEKNDYENQLKKIQKELNDAVSEINNLKKYTDDLLSENSSLIIQLKDRDEKAKNEDSDRSLKNQYLEAIQKLQESQTRLQILQDTVEELTNLKTMSDGEKCTYQFQATDYKNQLEDTQKIVESMKTEFHASMAALDSKGKVIEDLQYSLQNAEMEISDLKSKLSSKEADLKVAIDTKNELIELLQNANVELEATKKSVFNLQNQEVEVAEKNVRRNLERELQEIEDQKGVDDETEDNHAVDILTMEIRLREEIQEEYFKKLAEIENKYKKVCASSNELYKEQAGIVKNQENKFREYIATIINECTQKIKELEGDREDLIRQLQSLQNEYESYKAQAAHREGVIENMLKDAQQQSKSNSEKWQSWSKDFANNCLKLETTNKISRNRILYKMQAVDSQVADIEQSYNEKIKKYVKNCKI